MNEHELIHYGILGQKWGVRRYEDKNGHLTKAGKQRYSDSTKNKIKTGLAIGSAAAGSAGIIYGAYKKGGSKAFDQTVKGGKDKPNVSPTEKLLKETSSGLDKTSDLIRNVEKLNKKENTEDLSKYSNKELQDVITRKNLERQYRSITAEETESGYEKAQAILSVVGDVVGIAAAAATIVGVAKGLNRK